MPNLQETGDTSTSKYILVDLVFADSTKRTYTLEDTEETAPNVKERVEGLNLGIAGQASVDSEYEYYGSGMAQTFVSNNGEALVKIANVRIVEETIDIVYEY